MWFGPCDVQHGSRGISAGHAVATCGIGGADKAGAAAEVENIARAVPGEGEVEVPVFRARIPQIVDASEAGMGVVEVDRDHLSQSLLAAMHGADLVAVGVAQVGEVEAHARAFAPAGRVFNRLAAGGDAGRVPDVGLFR
jgi:hypothetical protein